MPSRPRQNGDSMPGRLAIGIGESQPGQPTSVGRRLGLPVGIGGRGLARRRVLGRGDDALPTRHAVGRSSPFPMPTPLPPAGFSLATRPATVGAFPVLPARRHHWPSPARQRSLRKSSPPRCESALPDAHSTCEFARSLAAMTSSVVRTSSSIFSRSASCASWSSPSTSASSAARMRRFSASQSSRPGCRGGEANFVAVDRELATCC